MNVPERLKSFFRQRLVQQSFWIIFWQISSKLVAFFANAWAARCLGPEKLGTSGMVLVTINQLLLVQHAINDPWLVRHFKTLPTQEEKYRMVISTTASRLLISILLVVVGLGIALYMKLGGNWWLSISFGVPFLIASALQPFWILQAEENIAKNSRAQAIGSFATGLLYLALFRPGMPIGSDMVVIAISMFTTCSVAWQATKPFRPQIKDVLKYCLSPDLLPTMWSAMKGSWWIAVSAWVNYLYAFLDMPLVGWFCGLEEVGRYRTASGLAINAVQFLGLLPYILFPRFIEWHKKGPQFLWMRQKQIAGGIFILCFIFCVFIWFVAPTLYHYLFGPEFQSAAQAFALLMIARSVAVIANIFWWGLLAIHKDTHTVIVFSIAATINIILNLSFVPKYGMYAAAYIAILTESVILVGSICYAYLASKKAPHITLAQ